MAYAGHQLVWPSMDGEWDYFLAEGHTKNSLSTNPEWAYKRDTGL
jgi:hypothetical protein